MAAVVVMAAVAMAAPVETVAAPTVRELVVLVARRAMQVAPVALAVRVPAPVPVLAAMVLAAPVAPAVPAVATVAVRVAESA